MTDDGSAIVPSTAAIDTSKYVPAQEVISELLQSPLPREARAFLAATSVETLLPDPHSGALSWPYSWSPFLVLFGFTEWTGSLAEFPPWGGAAVGGAETHAAGAWQDEPQTYAEIARMTGDPGFTPQSQIKNNWVLAVRDFGVRTQGGDLLAMLTAGELDKISPALSATWPEGCDASFPDRYTQALALFPDDQPAPTPPPEPPTQPPQPPPAPPMSPDLEVPVGFSYTGKIESSLMGIDLPMPNNALLSSAPGMCSVTNTGDSATFSGLALGNVEVTGPGGLDIHIAVVPAIPDQVTIDLAHGTFHKIAAAVAHAMTARLPVAAIAGAAMLGLVQSAGSPALDVAPAVFAPIALADMPAEPKPPRSSDHLIFCLQPTGPLPGDVTARWVGECR